MPKQAVSDSEIINCFNVMSELRTHLLKKDFLETVRHMETEGYKLAFIEDQGIVVSVAGYSISTNLFMGKNLYVYDLVTAKNHRSKGHGEKMVSWLRGVAKNADCRFYHLDSGTQRTEAHKFYLREGFSIASFHFSEQLN